MSKLTLDREQHSIPVSMRPKLFESKRPYVKPESEGNVCTHKAQGYSDSLIYLYFHSPLADWLVQAFCPYWLAPNLITVVGFAFNIATLLASLYLYGFSVEGPIDSWFCITMAGTFFIYNTLDNMDGKQARRTGAGSPMGMLFDHSCDAVTIVINNLLFQRMI